MKKGQKISDKTTVNANGFSYEYREHLILITPALGYLHGEIRWKPTNEIIAEGFCGYGLKTAIERINRRIDFDITNN